ncbi:MAG: UDP-N-acetylglucosamine 2-epimerase (non-hydrolyzing) [bacterium]|nr:UDP-N-acetylglucosamine 2-epimerase (non-hydrolyzing) [bacterium]
MPLKHQKNIAVVLGARPNFVKAAPFFREAAHYPELKFTLIHTGQHFDYKMSEIFFNEMQIPKPDIYLDVGGEFHTEKIGRMFNALTQTLGNGKFDFVILFGDVRSTLAGAIAAVASNQPIVHIEAGLRSHDRRMPEEIHRVIVDHLSGLLFTTEPSANENLVREGIGRAKIQYVGNLMIESMEMFQPKINASTIVNTLGLRSKDYIIATIHRQENTDDASILKNILSLIGEIAKSHTMILPLHPGTKTKIRDCGLTELLANIQVIEPLGYFDFIKLISESGGVITDSGGIQEETTHLGIPCATLRDNTERPITLELGSNKLFTAQIENSEEVKKHLARRDFKSKHIPMWDNQVSKRIFAHLETYLEKA